MRVQPFLLLAHFLLMANASASSVIKWEQNGDTLLKTYKLSNSGGVVYQTRIQAEKEKLTQLVQLGHPQQLGRLEVKQGQVNAYSVNGSIIWSGHSSQPICLPELFAEFIRLHRQALISGKTISCDGPIIKANKLAPFKVMLVKNGKDRLTFEISPGSIGMKFFMKPVFLDTDLMVKRLYRYQGVLPLATAMSGDMKYSIAQWSDSAGIEITDFTHTSMKPN